MDVDTDADGIVEMDTVPSLSQDMVTQQGQVLELDFDCWFACMHVVNLKKMTCEEKSSKQIF